jgi:hypothetical protein
MSADDDRMLDPADLTDLEHRPIAQVRVLRRACIGTETGLSYLRRLVQGSIDIIEGELEARAGRAHESAGDLIDALPDLLGEAPRPRGRGRLTVALEPAEMDDELFDRYRALADGGGLARVTDLDDAGLARLLVELQEIERLVSAKRHLYHHRIDVLQAELTRRYRTGEASVDSLLGST